MFPRLVAQHAYLAGGATRAAAGSRRSCTRGSPGSTTALPGTRRSRRSSSRPGASRPTSARTAATSTRASGRRTPTTTASSTSPRSYRDAGYADDGASQFLIEDPLFNAIWLWSAHALAEIAARIGEDPAPHRAAAARIHDGLMTRLWDGARFLPRDLRIGRLIDRRTILSLAPLLDPDLDADVARAVAGELASPHFRGPGGLGVASSDCSRPGSSRGATGAGRSGRTSTGSSPAGSAIQGCSSRPRRWSGRRWTSSPARGMREYFDPTTGEGLGAGDFSWTAAAVIDLLNAR